MVERGKRLEKKIFSEEKMAELQALYDDLYDPNSGSEGPTEQIVEFLVTNCDLSRANAAATAREAAMYGLMILRDLRAREVFSEPGEYVEAGKNLALFNMLCLICQDLYDPESFN